MDVRHMDLGQILNLFAKMKMKVEVGECHQGSCENDQQIMSVGRYLHEVDEIVSLCTPR